MNCSRRRATGTPASFAAGPKTSLHKSARRGAVAPAELAVKKDYVSALRVGENG